MKTKALKIEVPEGYEIDRENSTFENIVFKKLSEKDGLPETWEEFCKMTPIGGGGEYFVNAFSKVIHAVTGGDGSCQAGETRISRNRDAATDSNLFATKEEAEACVALCKLIQLRNYYNAHCGSKWDYYLGCLVTGDSKVLVKYTIYFRGDEIIPGLNGSEGYTRILSFRTVDIRNKFLKNFRDLIITAKPLL